MKQTVKKLYNNKTLGIIAVSFEILLEHLQTMSFMKMAPEKDGQEWSGSAKAIFDTLNIITLRFHDAGYLGLFSLACLIVTVSLLVYVLKSDEVHQLNVKKGTKWSILIWVVDHIFFGIGYMPLIGQYLSAQYCSTDEEMRHIDGVDCWDEAHIFMLQVGFFFIGIAIFVAAGILPVLKNERNGVETRVENENYFPGMYKTLIAGVALILAPIRLPRAGMVVTFVVIVYLLLNDCYKNLHISCMRMAVLVAQFWVFFCADITSRNGDLGSKMLFGWFGALIIGYISLVVKKLVTRNPRSVRPLVPKISHIAT